MREACARSVRREVAQRLGKLRETKTRIAAWRSDPALFAREALGIELWRGQRDVCAAVARDHRVAVRSGHKVGKSLVVAVLALWWATTMPRAGVVITAPTGRQVKRIAWAELRSLAARARDTLAVSVPDVPLDPGTGMHWADGRYVIGFSTDQPENMAGFSGPAMLFLIDEASGVDEAIFEAIRGNTAGGSRDDDRAVAKIVMTSNPTQMSGQFYRAFHAEQQLWRTFHVPSWSSPNVVEDKLVVPGLATPDYIEESRRAFGETSPLWDVRVAGDFPRAGGDRVVPLQLVSAAHRRFERGEHAYEPQLEIGLDVARFGDDKSAAAARRGGLLVELRAVHGYDAMQVAEMVLTMAARLRLAGEPAPRVKVDAVGVGGPVADILRRAETSTGDPALEVVDVVAGGASDEPDEYPDMRSQLWFALASWLEGGAIDPADDMLAGDLVAPGYAVDLRGRRVVERKADFKRRLGRSPDRADALALAVYCPPRPQGIIVPEVPADVGFRWGNARGFG